MNNRKLIILCGLLIILISGCKKDLIEINEQTENLNLLEINIQRVYETESGVILLGKNLSGSSSVNTSMIDPTDVFYVNNLGQIENRVKFDKNNFYNYDPLYSNGEYYGATSYFMKNNKIWAAVGVISGDSLSFRFVFFSLLNGVKYEGNTVINDESIWDEYLMVHYNNFNNTFSVFYTYYTSTYWYSSIFNIDNNYQLLSTTDVTSTWEFCSSCFGDIFYTSSNYYLILPNNWYWGAGGKPYIFKCDFNNNVIWSKNINDILNISTIYLGSNFYKSNDVNTDAYKELSCNLYEKNNGNIGLTIHGTNLVGNEKSLQIHDLEIDPSGNLISDKIFDNNSYLYSYNINEISPPLVFMGSQGATPYLGDGKGVIGISTSNGLEVKTIINMIGSRIIHAKKLDSGGYLIIGEVKKYETGDLWQGFIAKVNDNFELVPL